MDRKKWLQFLLSVGLPCTGLLLDLYLPNVRAALCWMPQIAPQHGEVLELSATLSSTNDRLLEWIDKQGWGDYPLAGILEAIA